MICFSSAFLDNFFYFFQKEQTPYFNNMIQELQGKNRVARQTTTKIHKEKILGAETITHKN